MREIKFRMWQKKRHGGEMIEFLLGEAITNEKEEIIDFDKVPVMQFTGLKDKNGKEIYEGDIIDWHFDTEFSRQVRPKSIVSWADATASFYCGQRSLASLIKKDICVVGNIYENPEIISYTPQPKTVS